LKPKDEFPIDLSTKIEDEIQYGKIRFLSNEGSNLRDPSFKQNIHSTKQL